MDESSSTDSTNTHEVVVLCNCDNIESCRMERYVSDIRILLALYGDPELTQRAERLASGRDCVSRLAADDNRSLLDVAPLVRKRDL